MVTQRPASPDTEPESSAISANLAELVGLRVQASRLNLGPRVKVLATRAGSHLSRFRGRGMEFDESRIYEPGDDIRNMDWRVTARTAQPHVKLFREERERPVWLVVDQGPSMRFGTRVAFKSVIAAQAAAIVAWAAAARGDRVGALVFSDTGHIELRPAARSRGVLPLLKALAAGGSRERGAPSSASLAQTLQRLSRLLRPGSLAFVLSDFRELGESGDDLLGRISVHSEVALGLTYDPLEAQAPPPGRYPVSDGRRFAILDTTRPAQRAAHQARFAAHRERLERLCRRYHMHFFTIPTDRPVAPVMAQALARRSAQAPHP